jgi:site-specific DNA-methyltransferase (adenine-specific)
MVPPSQLDELDAQGRIYWPPRGTMPAYKRYLAEMPGVPVQDLWIDIRPVQSQATERLGYPTQKPLELLDRIIQASSNEGDLVLDPFCGCGTTVCAAEKLGRRWIGIDITHLAIAAMESRLAGSFGEGAQYEVIGVPVDTKSARALAEQDRFQFEAWALSLIKAMPINDGKRGGDQGIDGEKPFIDEAKGKRKRAIIQVKSGHVNPSVVRDLRGVVTREKAALGFLITLEPPTSGMQTETLKAGYYESPGWGREYQKLQIRTIEQLLAGVRFDMPPARPPMPEAEPVAKESNQKKLL